MRHRAKRAFTLVELLVVLAIIALLIAMLLPALKKAKLAADGVKCASNLRTLMTAFRMFAEDHKGHLPGNKHESDNNARKGPGNAGAPWLDEKDSWRLDWLSGRFTGNRFIKEAPTKGTIWPYVRKKETYACPTQQASFGTVEMFYGSNERFDYAYFNCFSGNKLAKVKPQAQFRDNRSGVITFVPTPILVQEHEISINGANMEGGHSESDKMASCHNGGSYYASADGSVHFFIEYFDPSIAPADRGNQKNTARKSWKLEGPATRRLQDMGFDAYWGQWDNM